MGTSTGLPTAALVVSFTNKKQHSVVCPHRVSFWTSFWTKIDFAKTAFASTPVDVELH